MTNSGLKTTKPPCGVPTVHEGKWKSTCRCGGYKDSKRESSAS
jgi:hypothetical protein